MKIEWYEKLRTTKRTKDYDAHVQGLIDVAVKEAASNESGLAIVSGGDTLIAASYEGDDVVTVYECTIRREGEAEAMAC